MAFLFSSAACSAVRRWLQMRNPVTRANESRGGGRMIEPRGSRAIDISLSKQARE